MRNIWLQTAAIGFFLFSSLAIAEAGELKPVNLAINEVIDHYIELQHRENNVLAAELADDANLVRRLSLDLAGRIPTVSETTAYVNATAPQKWTMLVDRLLASPDFAYHHRNELDVMLQRDNSSASDWRKYLLEAAQENRSWDKMFREMMIGDENNPKEKAALTFLKKRAKSIDDLTNDTSSIFFGVNVSCAKCHDHPLVEDWQQDHFYGMASFFDRTYLTKKNLLAEKFSGTVKFKTTAGEEKTAKFMFLNSNFIEEPKVEKTKEQLKAEAEEVKKQMKDAKAPAPRKPDFSPRTKFVELALRSGDNSFFARSIVNRIWARLMGQGLVDPLDQMHSGNPPSHPELLDWLERDLIAHNYDLKRLIRGIVLSDTYARSSRWEGEGEPPEPFYFAVAIPRTLSPRQYSLSLNVAITNPESLAMPIDSPEWAKKREGLENYADSLKNNFELPFEHFQVSVDEALYLSNNSKIQDDFLRDSGDRIVGYLMGIEDKKQAIDSAFLTVLSRTPEPEERVLFEQYLAQREQNKSTGVQQAVWALITSPELRFNY